MNTNSGDVTGDTPTWHQVSLGLPSGILEVAYSHLDLRRNDRICRLVC